MKSLYILCVIFGVTFGIIHAQNTLELTKGQKFISGGFFLEGERNHFNANVQYGPSHRKFSMSMFAYGARLLDERTAVFIGSRFGLSLYKGNISAPVFQGLNAEGEEVYIRKYGYYEDKYTNLGLSLGARRYWWLNDRFYGALTLGLAGNYHWAKWDEPTLLQPASKGVWGQIQLDLSLKPGAMYLLSKRFGLEAELGGLNLGYRSRPEPESNKPNISLGLNNSDWLALGLVYFLP